MHDFVTTRDHVIFIVVPLVADPGKALDSGQLLHWRSELGTHVGIMPRDGGDDDVKWFSMEACAVVHPVNAHSDDQLVIVEVPRFSTYPLFGFDGQGPSYLTRWTFDLASGATASVQLDDCAFELPRVDPGNVGLPYRFVYGIGNPDPRQRGAFNGSDGISLNAVMRYDLVADTRAVHDFGETSFPGEPQFVPLDDRNEGNGVVILTVYRAAEDRSDLVILDAQNIESAPLAIVQLPHRMPFGAHTTWRANADDPDEH
jgi:carotenoid cleavage dioxygenase